MRYPRLVFIVLALVGTACGDDESVSPSGAAGGASSSGASSTGGNHPVPRTPSGYLLITKERLQALREEVKAGTPAWTLLKANVDKYMSGLDTNNCGPENIALAYLLTGDAQYAASAYEWAKQTMDEDVTSDSYL